MADLTRLDDLITWLQQQEAHMLEKTLVLSKDPQAVRRREVCKTTAETLTWVLDQAFKIRNGEVPPPPPPAKVTWMQRIREFVA